MGGEEGVEQLALDDGGAIFPLFTAMTADHFGEDNNASNYGMVHSSKLISGLVGSGTGAVVVNAWDCEGAFVIAGSIGPASAVLALFLRARTGRTPARCSPTHSPSGRRRPDPDAPHPHAWSPPQRSVRVRGGHRRAC